MSPRPQPLRDSDRFWLALLGLATVLAGTLRLSGLSQESLWADEAHSVAVAGFAGFSPELRHLDPGPHPMLFFRILGVWLQVVPPDDGWLRLLPALCGILAVPALYAFGRALLLPRPASVLGAFLLALDPHSIWYSQELRMYSLEGLLGLLHLAAGARLARCRRRDATLPWAAWLLTALALLHTHYFAVFYFAVDAVGFVAVIRRVIRAHPGALRRTAARGTLLGLRGAAALAGASILIGLVAGLPTLFDLLHQVRSGAGIGWLGRLYHITWSTPWEILDGLVTGPLIRGAPETLRVAAVAAFVLLVGAAAFRSPGSVARSLTSVRARRLWPATVAFLLIGLPTLVSLYRVVILGGDRYLEIAVGPLALAAGTGAYVAACRGWRTRAFAVLAIGLVLAAQAGYLSTYFSGREKQMFREAVGVMTSESRPGDTFLTSFLSQRLPIEFYTRGRVSFTGSSPPSSGRLWFFSESPAPTPLEARLVGKGFRRDATWEIGTSWSSTFLRLTRYVRR